MKTVFCLVAVTGLGLAASRATEPALEFSPIRKLTNSEMVLRLSVSTGSYCRIEVTTNLAQWNGFVTLLSTGANQHIDSAAPFLWSRFYRARALAGTNLVTGDHLATTSGEVAIHPITHASLALSWSNVMIYVDPAANPFPGVPRADLILFTHDHSDHFNANAIASLTNTNTTIIAPQAVYSKLPANLQTLTAILSNGMSASRLGLTIDAIPAYNLTAPINHPKGVGNGYVLTLGGRRVYLSGDTEDIPEMRALTNIDLSFLAMNRPYTMTVSQAVSAVRAFRPTVVYPYHYQPSTPPTDLNSFKQQVLAAPGIEVRLRSWY